MRTEPVASWVVRSVATVATLTLALSCSPPPPSVVVGPTPTLVPTGPHGSSLRPALALEFFPSGTPCRLAGLPPTLTFVIDADADDPVVAVSPNNRTYHVRWEEGFRSGPAGDPVVLDPEGVVVARNGEVMTNPADGSPELHGHLVCSGSETVYVFLRAAS